MGNQFSRQRKNRNRMITKKLFVDRQKADRTLKILLLGSSESGKTTIFKQIRLYYQKPFTPQEKKFFSSLVASNCFQTVKDLIRICLSQGILFKSPDLPRLSTTDSSLSTEDRKPFEVCKVASLANLHYLDDYRERVGGLIGHVVTQEAQAIALALEVSRKYNLMDSAEYFLREHKRIFSQEFDLTLEDILRARAPTTGVEEVNIKEQDLNCKILDVGGQRGERKKWVHLFDSQIGAVLYVVSLSEFDQNDPEDENLSRLGESVCLFDNLINGAFKKVPVILLLNKKDLMEKKIAKHKFKEFFPDFDGENELVDCIEFVKNKYVSRRTCNDSPIYAYPMKATDTKAFGVLWKTVKSIIFETNLKKSGLLYND